MPVAEADFDKIIGHVLRIGVICAFSLIALGSGLLFAEGQTGYGALVDAGQLYGNRFVLGLGTLFGSAVAAKPFAVIDLGLILLFATPLARVFVSVFLFLAQKRYVFVWITITVLVILMLSIFVIGPLLASAT